MKQVTSLRLSALGHRVSGPASHSALSLVVGLYFQSLTGSTCVAAMLPIPVVSLEAPKPFVAIEKRRITMFTETIDKAHASHKGTRVRHLLSLLIALVFSLTIYPTKPPPRTMETFKPKTHSPSLSGTTKL